MKKLLAGTGVAAVAALATWGTAAPAQAYSNDTPDGDTAPSSDVLGSAPSNGSGVLPQTGGPDTLLLVGGAALLAVGGVALVGARRRAND
jgi:LPXTG-motif cell wall-anchored protein